MTLLDSIKQNPIPQHIAVIMDGNGRWAQQKGFPQIAGHEQGVKSVRTIIEAAAEVGVKYLTLYAFSTENWNRSTEEVNALMSLFIKACHSEAKELHENNIQIKAIGNLDLLADECQKELDSIVQLTKNNTALTVVIAISYGSRWEIANAAKQIAKKVKEDKLSIEEINEETFSDHLLTANIPDPDLLIRTSNELRISNYLLWQIAYAELYFTQTLWPDFSKENLYEAIYEFQNRTRRFGKTNEQIQLIK